jgi:hypothetical protein
VPEIADEVTCPLPETFAEQESNGPSNAPAGMLIEKLIDEPEAVPETEPRPVIPVAVSTIVTPPENDVPVWPSCHDIPPGPDESDAEPVHVPSRLTVPEEDEGWVGLPDPPVPPVQAPTAMKARTVNATRCGFKNAAAINLLVSYSRNWNRTT